MSPYQADQPQEPYQAAQSQGPCHAAQPQEPYQAVQPQGPYQAAQPQEPYQAAQPQETLRNMHENRDYIDRRCQRSQNHQPPGGWRYQPYSPIERHGGQNFRQGQNNPHNSPGLFRREENPWAEELRVNRNRATLYDHEEEEATYSSEVRGSNESAFDHAPGFDMRSQAPSPPSLGSPLPRPGTGPYNIAATPLITGMPLIPGRFSGVGTPPPKVNKMPEFVAQETVSDAALLKRGLKRSGEARVASRAVGATDPDNIMIINMFDNERLTWTEISQRMNQQRIMKGAKPNFTPNSCHNRYNRNAPLLYATDGREWVPVHKRRNYKRGIHLESEAQGADPEEALSSDPEFPSPLDEYNDNMEIDQFTWDAQCDLALVQAKKRIDSQLWPSVAKLFHETTGLKVSPTIAANRFALI